ncbi:MAG: ABC transporter ATP-binding protein [Kiritimatiellae bacterium]|nr:ABC transporter ATP-binding protein [Kiritimatiellia bacterium]
MPPPFHGHHQWAEHKCPKCGRRISAPDAKCLHCSGEGGKILRRLLSLLAPYRGLVIAMMALNAIGAAVSLAPPYITKRIVDDVIVKDTGGSRGLLVALCGAMLAASCLRYAINFIGGVLAARVGSGIVRDLRHRLHDAIQRIELSFFGRRDSGEYTGRIMHDTEEIQRFLVDGSRDLIVQGLTMVGIAIVLICMNWRLFIIVALPAPLLFLVSRRFHEAIHSMFHDMGAGVAKLNTRIAETLGGIRTIKAFAQEDARNAGFNALADDVAGLRVALDRRFLGFFGATSLIMDAATAAVWCLAGLLIIGGGNMSIGDLTAFIGYVAMFFGPIRWMTHIVNNMVNALVGAERVFAVLDAPREDDGHGEQLQAARGDIEIRDVVFGYDKSKRVLDGMSLHVRPGEMVGLVGRSGVGKTTLVNLICRFYRVDEGEILIDGKPVNSLDIASWRHQIGMVLQDPFLFSATIRENIAIARPGASMDEVIAAAKAARAHDFIMAREKGYDTLVGDGGELLSGGERQRIAIARAILHNPPVLILDEATSAVDTETERLIRDALAALCKGRTVIAIAHRLSTLRNADRLALIDGGKVAEIGTHDELLALNGRYASLVKAQTDLNTIKSDVWNPA